MDSEAFYICTIVMMILASRVLWLSGVKRSKIEKSNNALKDKAAVGEMVPKVTHDLKNLVFGQNMISRLLIEKSEEDGDTYSLEAANASLTRLDAVNDFLKDLSGTRPTVKKPVAIGSLVKRVVSSYGHYQVTLVIKCEFDTITDGYKLERILSNLVSNALKHGTGNTRVVVSHKIITVENNVNKPPGSNIWSEGYSSGSSGLGLSIVRRFVTELGLEIKMSYQLPVIRFSVIF